jgi:hypothetical protein
VTDVIPFFSPFLGAAVVKMIASDIAALSRNNDDGREVPTGVEGAERTNPEVANP